MNLYPYNNGHIMIIPNRHISDYTELTAAERNRLAELTNISLQVLKKALNPQGFNIGYNLGAAAGAGIASHMHQHIVPRWSGDTNFMPVVADIKVISEHMDETYRKLLKVFKELPLPSRGWHDLL
jgi:ATP adenylyltransferase